VKLSPRKTFSFFDLFLHSYTSQRKTVRSITASLKAKINSRIQLCRGDLSQKSPKDYQDGLVGSLGGEQTPSKMAELLIPKASNVTTANLTLLEVPHKDFSLKSVP
jgi:hypothetical protein